MGPATATRQRNTLRQHLHILFADLRYGFRTLIAAPAFTVVALLAIALGIGATTAVFSLVNAVLLRSLPYADAQNLVYIWTPNPKLEGTPLEMSPANADYADLRRQSRSYTQLAQFDPITVTYSAAGATTRLNAARVTGNFFKTLGVAPRIGRAISSEDDQPGHGHVAVIGDTLWRSAFNGDARAIGKTIHFGRTEYTVIGVMPPSFVYPHEGDFRYTFYGSKRTEVWIPYALTPAQIADRLGDDGVVVGRLRPGVTLKQAQAEASAIEARSDQLWPAEYRGWTALVVPFVDSSVGAVRTMLWLLLGAVGLVLLIACSNVANLLAARAAARAHEMGLRSALGAERARLVRQMLTEALALAVCGAVLGVFIAYAAVRLVVSLNPGDIPRLAETSLDSRVLLFTLAISVITGFVFGILPALSASRVNLSELMKQGGTRGSTGASNQLRHGLIVAEVALAVILLAGSGLLIRSYLKLQGVDTGFNPSTLGAGLMLDERYDTPQKQLAFFDRVVNEIGRLPGVQAAGATRGLPLGGHGSLTFLEVDGYPNRKNQTVDSWSVTPHYFDAMNIPLLAGRFFAPGDAPGRVFVVDRRFAQVYFRGRNPIGAQIRMGDPGTPWSTIIGVVGDVRHASIEEAPRPAVYSPFSWSNGPNADLAIRWTVPVDQTIPAIRGLLRSMDPALAFTNVRTMGERVDDATARRRFQTVVLAVFAAVALFLALVGLYGLMAYAVKRRTPEIGIRMALGASRGQVLGMVLRQGLGLVVFGLALGLAGALALTRLMGSYLFEVPATDPLTFAVVPVLLVVVATCACLVPGWRATRIDPMSALRYE